MAILTNMRDRRDYFLTILMFKYIHGIAPTYLSDRVVMNFDVNGYDTRGSNMELYLPTLRKESYRNSFMYMGGKLWNDLPECVQNSANIEPFKRNYKMSKLLINSWLIQQFCACFCDLSGSVWWNDCFLLSEPFALYLDVDGFLYLILHIPYWIMFQFPVI